MVYRRGELSKHTIDRDWPHQIALPAYRCTGGNYVTIHLFCDGEGLSLCPRGHSFYRDGTDMNVFCFAEREHAERFRERFGGELIDPRDRPKWHEAIGSCVPTTTTPAREWAGPRGPRD